MNKMIRALVVANIARQTAQPGTDKFLPVKQKIQPAAVAEKKQTAAPNE